MCPKFDFCAVNFNNVFWLPVYQASCHHAAAGRWEKGEPWPHVCASLELFHSPVLSTVQRFCQLATLGWGYTLSITITIQATAVAQCHEGDCRTGLCQVGFKDISHSFVVQKSIVSYKSNKR